MTDPVDRQMIANRLGVKPETVSTWKLRNLLPPPDYPQLAFPVWEWATIEAWAKTTERLPTKGTQMRKPGRGTRGA